MANSTGLSILLTLLGLNRAEQRLYVALFVLAVPALMVWTVVLPRLRFSDQDEALFRAARHGDRAGVESSLAAGADVNAAAPVDHRTALFRAGVFGHAGVVRLLIERGASTEARGSDGRTALELVTQARAQERNPDAARALAEVETVLGARRATP